MVQITVFGYVLESLDIQSQYFPENPSFKSIRVVHLLSTFENRLPFPSYLIHQLLPSIFRIDTRVLDIMDGIKEGTTQEKKGTRKVNTN